MKSYAIVDAKEGTYTVLELLLHEMNESKNMHPKDKKHKIVEFLTDEIIKSVGEFDEGDVIIVEQEEGKILYIYGKDEEEKQRRINIRKEIRERRRNRIKSKENNS